MNLQTRPREQPEINLTSLIDVVLLLLVFFMVSTSFVREAELRLDLPEASQTPSEDATLTPLEITITADGAYRVNGRELINNDPQTLRRALQEAAGERADLPVTVRADARTNHQSVVTAMDVAGQLGFVRIHIVTVKEEDR